MRWLRGLIGKIVAARIQLIGAAGDLKGARVSLDQTRLQSLNGFSKNGAHLLAIELRARSWSDMGFLQELKNFRKGTFARHELSKGHQGGRFFSRA